MPRIMLALLVVAVCTGRVRAQGDDKPAVIKKMEELGTVYLTFKNPPKTQKKAAKDKPAEAPKKDVIIGVDFRPMAGTDPKDIVAVVKELATLPELQSVLLLGRDVDDAAAGAIPVTPKITSIQFYNTSITDKGIATLKRFTKLQRFHYTGMGLTDAGMKDLGQIRSLSDLTIIDAKITDAGVLALRGLPRLFRLIIENTDASARAIERLRESLPGLVDGERFFK